MNPDVSLLVIARQLVIMNKLKMMEAVGTLAGDDAYVGGSNRKIRLETLYKEVLEDENRVRD